MKRPAHIVQTACLLLFLQPHLPHHVDGSAHAFKGQEIAKLCKLTAFLAKLPGDGIAKLQAEATALGAAQEAAALAGAAAAAATSQDAKLVFQATAAAAAACGETAATGLAAKAASAVSAAAQGAREVGHIAEMVNFLKQAGAGGGSTGYCLTKISDENAAADGSEAELNCDKQELQFAPNLLQYAADDITDDGFPALPGADAKSTTANNKCKLFHKANAGANSGDLFQTPGLRTFMNGMLTVTTVATSAPDSLSIGGISGIATGGKSRPGALLGQLYDGVQDLKKLQTGGCGTDAKTAVTKVIDGGQVHTLLSTLLQATGSDTDKANAEQRATKMLERVAGSPSGLGPEIFKKITEQQAMHIDGSKATPKQLKQITGAANHRLTELYHTMMAEKNLVDLQKKIEDLASQTAAASKKTPTKKDCKEHTEKDACQNAGCKFDGSKKDDEKSFPDPETKTQKKDGGDGKTGSASTCRGKSKEQCKSPNSKWESKTCKDSSFFLLIRNLL
uniref:Variant surface glycoprotein 1125.4157 n=1 Tax=Trypanosoma brucei TaxID=5691 RepID=A0A1J0RA58_9TRYP|nr:variant surface glycoprotein 1125.4157 [Trypanosoma brucei]